MFSLLKHHRKSQLCSRLLPVAVAFAVGFTASSLFHSWSESSGGDGGDWNSPQSLHHSLSASDPDHSAFLVVLIFTAPKNVDRRTAIRTTWLKFTSDDDNGGGVSTTTDRRRIRHFFVVGTLNLPVDDRQTLDEEHAKHGDLLLLPYLQDGYDRLTGKLVESLRWLARLHHFDYLLKVDDDSFVRLDALYDEMVEKDRGWPDAQKLLYWGYFDGRAHVHRTGAGKWVEQDWFLCDRYLPYALGGGYLLSRRLVDFVVTNAALLQRYHSEDVSLGVWLSPLAINRVHDTRFDTEYQSRGCIDSYLVQHRQSTLDMQAKYRSVRGQERLCGTGEMERKLAYEYNWTVPPSKCCVRNVTMMS